ncbi:MAG: nucleolar RNA-binding Nop10p family protein [Candidatus Anstonellaceae archaeon]
MRRCSICNAYTLDEIHCGTPTKSPHPPKFSLQEKYAKYRRQLQ